MRFPGPAMAIVGLLAACRDTGMVRGDRGRMRQCLLNLLSNAAKFTENGSITLSVIRESRDGRDGTRFDVEDTGAGITADDLERIFGRFEQVRGQSGRGNFEGTGIGLPLSRHLAQIMGGDLTAVSQVGQGSTFSLWVPLCPS